MTRTRVLVAAGALISAAGSAWAAGPSTSGLMLWLDSSDQTSVTTNGGGVTAWANKAPGATNGVTWSGANDNSTTFNGAPPSYVAGPNGVKVVDFTRSGYLSNLAFDANPRLDLTLFILTTVDSNPGAYTAVMATRQSSGVNDYQTGINIDQGEPGSATFARINVEGAKAGGGGGFDLLADPIAFGSYHLFEISYGGGAAGSHRTISVSVDGVPRGSLTGNTNPVNLNQLFIGTRAYVSGGVPTANHNLDGKMAAVLMYDGQLAGAELTKTRDYLNSFFAPYLDGDFNFDRRIDAEDLTILNEGFRQQLSAYPDGDIDRNGRIDRDDYAIFDRAKLNFEIANAPAPGGLVTAVAPEPGAALALAGAVVAVGIRRRRVS